MNMNKTSVILSLAVLLMPCGAFAGSGLDKAANDSQAAVTSESLADASMKAGQSFADLVKTKKDGVSTVQINLAPGKNEPVQLSAVKKPEPKQVPVLAKAASAPAGAAAKCPEPQKGPLSPSAKYDEMYCTISSNGTGPVFLKIMGVAAGSCSAAAAHFEIVGTKVTDAFPKATAAIVRLFI